MVARRGLEDTEGEEGGRRLAGDDGMEDTDRVNNRAGASARQRRSPAVRSHRAPPLAVKKAARHTSKHHCSRQTRIKLFTPMQSFSPSHEPHARAPLSSRRTRAAAPAPPVGRLPRADRDRDRAHGRHLRPPRAGRRGVRAARLFCAAVFLALCLLRPAPTPTSRRASGGDGAPALRREPPPFAPPAPQRRVRPALHVL